VNGYADDFELTDAATIRSVTWRGMYDSANTPMFPTSFDLTIYDDVGGLPGTVLSNTTVNITGVDTGDDLGIRDVYEFQADLTATPLLGGTTYWFSTLADTNADTDDDWRWTSGFSNDASATQDNVTGSGPWSNIDRGPFYFVLDDQSVIPVPATAAFALVPLAMLRRRLKGVRRKTS